VPEEPITNNGPNAVKPLPIGPAGPVGPVSPITIPVSPGGP